MGYLWIVSIFIRVLTKALSYRTVPQGPNGQILESICSKNTFFVYNKRWPFASGMLWMIKVEANRQNNYTMPWRLLTSSDPCVLFHRGWGQPPSCVAKNTTPSIFNYMKTQAVAGEGVGAGVLVGRVDFEMQTIGSSPLQMSASVCSQSSLCCSESLMRRFSGKITATLWPSSPHLQCSNS